MKAQVSPTHDVPLNRYSTFAATMALALSAISSHAQETFDGAAGNSRMTPSQVRAVGTLKGLRSLRTDHAGLPSRIEADLGLMRSRGDAFDADSRTLLRNIASLYRLDGTESLQLRRTNRDERGRRHVRVKQLIDGLEVIGGDAILHGDDATGRIDAIDSHFLSGTSLPRTATISAKAAYDRALNALGKPGTGRVVAEPRLAFARTPDAKGHLVWNAEVEYEDEDGARRLDQLLLDARSGAEIWRMPRQMEAMNRAVYDYRTGALLAQENQSTSDVDAFMAMVNAGAAYRFFLQQLNRDSWDNRGGLMKMLIHGTSRGQNTAFYTLGSGIAQFGDGDGVQWLPFARSRDVVVHEWVHAITDVESGLLTSGESGGLHEALSDIFAAAADASIAGMTADTWKMGEQVFTPAIAGDARRYMDNPGRDGQSMDFYPEADPSMNVHHLAGIANLAFYLLVTGGSHPTGKSSPVVSGIGMQDAQMIFYWMLRDKLLAADGFAAVRNKTAQVAREQFGANSLQHLNVCKAWDAVAVPNDGSECPAVTTPNAPILLFVSSHCYSSSVIMWNKPVVGTYSEVWRSQLPDFSNPTKVGIIGGNSWSMQTTAPTYVRVKVCNAAGCSPLTNTILQVQPRNDCPQ